MNWYKTAKKLSLNKALEILSEKVDYVSKWEIKGDYVAILTVDGDLELMTKAEVIKSANETLESIAESEADNE